MAVIIQADPYQCLMRKIGYSVGLEDVLNRVLSLIELYYDKRNLTYVDFKDLIENKFHRKNSVEHFANFYGTLNLVKLIGLDIQPLYTLDTLSILRQYFENDDSQFKEAVRIVLAQSIIEADGEVFLNALVSNFEASAFKSLMEKTIKEKRNAIRNVIKTQTVLKKIFSIIDVESSPPRNKEEGREKEKTQSRFEGRKEKLDSILVRKEKLTSSFDDSIHISNDYLRKVPQTRKGWAQDLELFGKDHITDRGRNLLDALRMYLKLDESSDYFVFWAYVADLAKIRIKPQEISAHELDSWGLLCAIAQGMCNIDVSAFDDRDTYDDVIDKLHLFHRMYRDANNVQGRIRHQLPLYVVKPCIVASYSAESKKIPPLNEILDREGKSAIRRVQKIIVRETEGALVFAKR